MTRARLRCVFFRRLSDRLLPPLQDASDGAPDSAIQAAQPQPQPLAPNLNLTPGVPLDPWDPSLITSLLNTLNPPLTAYEGFVNLGGESFEGASALRLVKRSAKSGGAMLQLGRETYEVKQCVGSGAFASVYLAYRMDAGYTTDLMDESEDDGMLALKVRGGFLRLLQRQFASAGKAV